MKKVLLFQILILIATYSAKAQYVRCNTDLHQAELDKAYPQQAYERQQAEMMIRSLRAAGQYNRSSTVITIPVVFHVIYNTTAQNIPDARILEQLNVLNQDFARNNPDAVNTRSMFLPVAANTQIQFCLAQRTPQGTSTTGIVRVQTTQTSLPNNPNTISPEWDHTKYLNIYIGNLSGGLLGYANLPPGTPGNDHVVILYSAIGGPNVPGTATPYHLGRTATHEVGHWLNLQHTFNGGCQGTTANTCTTSGDFICDTPPVAGSTFSCPANNPNTCTEIAPFPPPYSSNMPDMFENYMDYSDDGCMNIFTSDQSDRMNDAVNMMRVGLLTSDGCTPVGLNEILDSGFILVTPNPSKGMFTVEFLFPATSKVDISIADMKGQKVFEGAYKPGMNSSINIDLTEYGAGVYQMMVNTRNGYLVKQLVITK